MTYGLSSLAIAILVLYGFLVTCIRYYRLKKVIPALVKDYKVDPAKTYLISGNKATYLRVITFNDEGIRQFIITNYWIRDLSLIDNEAMLKYQDIDYVIYVPFFNFDFVLKNDVKSLFSNTFSSFMAIGLPSTYAMNNHTLFNIGFIRGSVYRAIMKELNSHGVDIRKTAKGSTNKRNNQILLGATAIIIAISLVYCLFSIYL